MPEEIKEVAMDVSNVEGRKKKRRTRKAFVSVTESTQVVKDEAPKVVEAKPVVEPPVVAKKPTLVILAPAKAKVPKVMLVPKEVQKIKPTLNHRKTFKAKRVHVVIDNTKKTQTRRRKILADIDSMSEETLRAAAVSAKLSRLETVAKVPAPLLRQLMKDYRMMRGLLV